MSKKKKITLNKLTLNSFVTSAPKNTDNKLLGGFTYLGCTPTCPTFHSCTDCQDCLIPFTLPPGCSPDNKA